MVSCRFSLLQAHLISRHYIIPILPGTERRAAMRSEQRHHHAAPPLPTPQPHTPTAHVIPAAQHTAAGPKRILSWQSGRCCLSLKKKMLFRSGSSMGEASISGVTGWKSLKRKHTHTHTHIHWYVQVCTNLQHPVVFAEWSKSIQNHFFWIANASHSFVPLLYFLNESFLV